MQNNLHGRQLLRAWEHNKPKNFFKSDLNLQNVLKHYLGFTYSQVEESFIRFGEQAATVIDEAAKVEDHIGNHPRLERWSGIGERIEGIEFHPNHDRIGRIVWEAGLMALQNTPGQTVRQMGLYYLLGHNGEGGHMCSLACTSGLIRALQNVADERVQAKFLPLLLTTVYESMQHGAQFLTEIQGGSDVGANALHATDRGDGTWLINGEKWFCSNVNAQQFLLTARPDHAPDGTRGLGLFLVQRTLDDGRTNGFYIRRLKDKLGTRTLASAELDFRDAIAYPVGAIDRGFKNTVELVLNTSRLMNAVGCAGGMRRAYIEAAYYACYREAFGKPIASYPLVQEAVADILSESCAAISSSFYLAHLLDKIETNTASEDDQAVYRLLVNVNKYITSIHASESVHRAIEVLGGNGAIESFSILPRLYRDMIVFESWEGSHNVLCLQVLRDISRYGIYPPFVRMVESQLATVHQFPDQSATHGLHENADHIKLALWEAGSTLEKFVHRGHAFAEAHSRRLVDRLGYIAQAALMLSESVWELQNEQRTYKPDVLTHFVNRHLRTGYDPMDDGDYLARLERLIAANR